MSIVVLPKQNPEICLLWCTALIINWNACKLMLKEFIGHELNPMLQIKWIWRKIQIKIFFIIFKALRSDKKLMFSSDLFCMTLIWWKINPLYRYNITVTNVHIAITNNQVNKYFISQFFAVGLISQPTNRIFDILYS